MRAPAIVTEVEFTPARRRERKRGIIGFATVVARGFRIDGLAIRRTRDGRIVIAFPARLDRRGDEHTIVRPIDAGLQRAIEIEVLAALRARGVLP